MRIFLFILLLPLHAAAQDAPPDIPPGDDVITALAQGDRAPHAGMLLDTDTAIRWTHRLSWYQNELRLTLRSSEAVLAAVRSSHETELRLARESYEREITGLRGDLRTQAQQLTHEQPWYDTFGFGFAVGVVTSGILVGLTAWAASAM